jgi:hypothetical protein
MLSLKRFVGKILNNVQILLLGRQRLLSKIKQKIGKCKGLCWKDKIIESTWLPVGSLTLMTNSQYD